MRMNVIWHSLNNYTLCLLNYLETNISILSHCRQLFCLSNQSLLHCSSQTQMEVVFWIVIHVSNCSESIVSRNCKGKFLHMQSECIYIYIHWRQSERSYDHMLFRIGCWWKPRRVFISTESNRFFNNVLFLAMINFCWEWQFISQLNMCNNYPCWSDDKLPTILYDDHSSQAKMKCE